MPRSVSVEPGDGRLHFFISRATTAEVLSLNGQLLKRYSFAGAVFYSVAAPRFGGVYLVRVQARTFAVGR